MMTREAQPMENLLRLVEMSSSLDLQPKKVVQDLGQIMNVAWGLGRTGIIIAALELNVFDCISQGCRTPEEIAQKADANSQGIKLLLDSLVDLEFICKDGGDNYFLSSSASVYLVEDSPLYVGHMWKVHKYLNWKVWEQLSETIKTGKPAENLFSFQGSKIWEIVIPYLNSLAKPMAFYIIDLLNLGAKENKFSILDVGCGSGIYSQLFAKCNPNIKVVGIDQGNVLQIAIEQASQIGVEAQVEYLNADFNEIEFGQEFDVVLFSNIFHGFDRETNIKLMQKAFSALNNNGIMIINEFLRDEKSNNITDLSAILSLHFYLVGQGKVYNFSEYKAWLNLCGFSNVQHYPLSGLSSIILATKLAN